MLGDKAAKEINLVPLSKDTVKRRIDELADNIKDQLIERVKKSQYYSLQLDESTDISNHATLVCFVRYEFDGKILEDLFCKALKTNTTADAIFCLLNDFLLANNILWSECVGLTTDGARAMSGKYTGLRARVDEVAPSVTWNHCCIHREALAVKNMPKELKCVLDEAVKVVNFIKTRALQSRIFSALCEEMGSDHIQLLKHAEVRWLSRGKVLNRLFELRDELRLFFVEAKFDLAERFNDFSWLAMLAYLADIFNSLNTLTLSLQGESVTMFKVEEKIEAMIKKLNLWSSRVNSNNFESFSTLLGFLEESDDQISKKVRKLLTEHLQGLSKSFRQYFPVQSTDNNWIRYPFTIEPSSTKLTSFEQDSLAEISSDSALKLAF